MSEDMRVVIPASEGYILADIKKCQGCDEMVDAYLLLAKLAYERKKNTDNAADVLNKFLSFYPDHPRSKEVKELLYSFS